MNDKVLMDASYVNISSYRLKVVDCLSKTDVMIPSGIAESCGIKTNHISKVLRELKDKEIIVCLNEEARKGRLYRLTDYGHMVITVLEKHF